MSEKKSFCEYAVVILLFVAFVFIMKPAEALTIETFTDRSNWESALSNIYQENFNSFLESCYIPSFPDYREVGVSFKLQELNNNTLNKNIITPKTKYSLDLDGSSYINGLVEKKSMEEKDHAVRLSFVFDDPITAFGADFRNANNGSGIDFLLTQLENDSDGELISGKTMMRNDGFFGFLINETSENIRVITLQASGRMNGERALLSEGFGMDNIMFVKADYVEPRQKKKEPTNSVPEPCTFFLLGSLLICFGVIKKRSE